MSIATPGNQSGFEPPSWRAHGAHVPVPGIHLPRSARLPFARPALDESELTEVSETLRMGCVAPGPRTEEFERDFANTVNVDHAIAVNSYSAALHIAFRAIGLERGNEVITSPYTDAALAHVIRELKARPVFVDVDPDTLNLNTGLLEGAITPHTRAIVPNHVAGLPADMDRLLAIAKHYHLRVIGDAAYAYPARTSDQMIGQIGDLTCFSFSAAQPMTTGAGGVVCTADANLADQCRAIAAGQTSMEDSAHTVDSAKWRMTDIAAALGIAQLRKADQMWHRRLEIAISYNATFSGSKELQCPEEGFLSQHAWCLYMLRLNLHRLRIDRDEFLAALAQRRIAASVHFTPLHLLPEHRERFAAESFPVALQEYEREVSLPIYPGMTDRDVQDVIDAVTDTIEANRC